MEESGNQLSQLLTRARKEKGMSLREFGEYLDISHAYLRNLEKGTDPRTGRRITPTIDTLQKIAYALKLPTRSFLEQCGYFEDFPASGPALELTDCIEDFIGAVSRAERVSFNGREIKKDDLDKLTAELRAELHFVLQKHVSRIP